MEDLSLHILDIAENAIRAQASKIEIEILEDVSKDQLAVTIKDNGIGMDEETAKKAVDPFFTTKDGKKTGLGISLLAHAAQQAGGKLKIESKKGIGTQVAATFKLSHADMQPIGNIAGTIAALVAGNPKVQFIYNYKKGEHKYYFDSCK